MKGLAKATRFLSVFECILAPSNPRILAWGLFMLSLAATAGQALAGGAEMAGLQPRPDHTTNLAPSLLQQFKDFISHPPVIKNLVFAKKIPMSGGMLPLDGSFAYSTRWEYFQVKWQSNGMLFRRLGAPTDATNFNVPAEFVSVSDHKYAVVEPTRVLTTWDDRDPSVVGKNISIFFTRHCLLQPLREMMSLGIMYAGIGAVRWQGNRFRTESVLNHQRVIMTGEVAPSENGPPMSMTVRYAFPHQTNDYVLRYGYAPGSPYPFVPSVITNFWVTGRNGGRPREMELNQWRIISVKLREAPLPARAFALKPFLKPFQWKTRVYTNGAIYDVGPDGALQFAYALGGPTGVITQPPVIHVSRPVFYAAWGAVNLLIFALMLGARESKQKPIAMKGESL